MKQDGSPEDKIAANRGIGGLRLAALGSLQALIKGRTGPTLDCCDPHAASYPRTVRHASTACHGAGAAGRSRRSTWH